MKKFRPWVLLIIIVAIRLALLRIRKRFVVVTVIRTIKVTIHNKTNVGELND